mgnify:CR=1 FL=1
MGGPTYKNVQTKTMAVLESELPEAEQGGEWSILVMLSTYHNCTYIYVVSTFQ